MSRKNEISNEFLTETRSTRLSILKRIWNTRRSIFFLSRKDDAQSSFAMNLGNKFLWAELNKAGYNLDVLPSKSEQIDILWSDIQTLKGFSESRASDLFRLICKIVPAVQQLSRPKQKMYMKVILTIIKISEGNDTNIVGASVRARVEFQANYFKAAVKKEHQNAALDAICELGFGELNRGASYLMLESLDLLGAPESVSKTPTLSKVHLAYPHVKEEIKEIDVLDYLSSLGLIDPALLEVAFTENKQTRAVLNPETGLHTLVDADGSVNFQKFKLLLSSMDDAYKAFKTYCDGASEEYTLIREAWKGSEEGKAALAAKRETELMASAEREINNVSRKVVAEEKKKINITEKRQQMLDLGLAILVENGTRMIQFNISTRDKEYVLAGKMKMVKGVPTWNHDYVDPDAEVEPEIDYSSQWAHLLADSDDEVVEVRINKYAGMTFEEKKIAWAKEKEEDLAHAFDDILALL